MQIEPGRVSRLPSFDGDGYGYGGELVVSFGERSIKLGTRDGELAAALSAMPDLLTVAEMLVAAASVEIPARLISLASVAIAKAKSHEHF